MERAPNRPARVLSRAAASRIGPGSLVVAGVAHILAARSQRSIERLFLRRRDLHDEGGRPSG